ncbi:hypothetical protein FQU96_10780 [Reyranella sp. CPCC 100927]|nr:hypothetical protein FQU96_10780 [Reyranella sp. CPCC 100927]
MILNTAAGLVSTGFGGAGGEGTASTSSGIVVLLDTPGPDAGPGGATMAVTVAFGTAPFGRGTPDTGADGASAGVKLLSAVPDSGDVG